MASLLNDKPVCADFYYKYTDHHVVDVLSELRLKVTPPKEFNDPSEFLPYITSAMTLRKAKKALKCKPSLLEMHKRWVVQGYTGSFRDFKKFARSPEMAQLTAELFPAKLSSYKDRFQEQVSKDHGVLCLCKNPANAVMWSHYADSHKGAVIALSAKHRFFTDADVKEVEYNDERVHLDPTWERSCPPFKVYQDAIIRRKSTRWSYEEEVRILWRLEDCESCKKEGRQLFFCKIPGEAIAKIIFGMHCPNRIRDQLKGIAEKQGPTIQFEEAYVHESKFDLLFRPA